MAQPGRWVRMSLVVCISLGIGCGALHAFATSSGLKRPSFMNTGQSSIIPEPAVQV